MAGDSARVMEEANDLAESGAFSKAAEVFARAAGLAEGPEAARPLEAQAQCLLELGRIDEAVAAAKRATELRPEWAAGFATLGRALLNGGNLQDAVDTLAEAARLAEVAAAAPAASPAERELAEELAHDSREARGHLARHWADHHDVMLRGASFTSLTIRQSFDCRYCRLSGQQGPGGAIWAAGVVLAQQLLSQPPPPSVGAPSWKGLRILELGSGTGMAGLAAAASGAEVLLTDRQDLVALMQQNIGLNNATFACSSGKALCGVYDWLTEPPPEVLRPWDLVIAADVIYSFAAVEPFAQALCAVLAPPAPVDEGVRVGAPLAIYAHNPRSSDLDAEMLKAFEARGLSVKEVGRPGAEPVGNVTKEALQRVVLYEIRPARPVCQPASGGACATAAVAAEAEGGAGAAGGVSGAAV
mmetsp:Transcript_37593/g.100211  ORF Transcript_37593/g.100211 Transcript_37593/m.100211 type:complete len:415 (-) Transcript_37593:15-1259(-)